METTQLTCAYLYEVDPTFRSAIGKWIADRRCPIQLGDYLEELGLFDAADCARWAASEPDRDTFEGYKCGPFPAESLEHTYYWFVVKFPYLRRAHWLPGKLSIYNLMHKQTIEKAILHLMDNWKRD